MPTQAYIYIRAKEITETITLIEITIKLHLALYTAATAATAAAVFSGVTEIITMLLVNHSSL